MEEYQLTEQGRELCESYIREMKAKAKEILDAGKDTSDETSIDYTADDIFADLLDFGIDEDGCIFNGYGVTDHYDMEYPLCLQIETDFIQVK